MRGPRTAGVGCDGIAERCMVVRHSTVCQAGVAGGITPSSCPPVQMLILNEVDRMSKEAQHSLRRTMEKYTAACRIVLCCTNVSKARPRCSRPFPCGKEEDGEWNRGRRAAGFCSCAGPHPAQPALQAWGNGRSCSDDRAMPHSRTRSSPSFCTGDRACAVAVPVRARGFALAPPD